MDRIKKLRQRKADLVNEAGLLAAKEDDNTITAEESARYAAIIDKDLPVANAAVAREERLMDERRTMVVSEPEVAAVVAPKVPAEAKKDPAKFSSFGEQLQSIAKAGLNKGIPYQSIDNRLVFQAGGAGVAGHAVGATLDVPGRNPWAHQHHTSPGEEGSPDRARVRLAHGGTRHPPDSPVRHTRRSAASGDKSNA